jgi:hypothetical protein
MFGKKKRIIIEVTGEHVRIRNIKGRKVGELMEVIKAMAGAIERDTTLSAQEVLTKCIFELI